MMEDIALLVLRLVLGGVFVAHGAQKLFGSFGGPGIEGTTGFHEQLGIKPAKPMAILAGLAEFIGGILVIAGFLTPLAALALIGVMVVAVLSVHLKNGFFAANGGYEFNLVLVAVAATLVLVGSGAYGLDAALGIFWN
ncbi:MAG TPA: DoxX family protein [Rubrobacter sp.]|nr:DoxX family protein [Rubrobacter sp.]